MSGPPVWNIKGTPLGEAFRKHLDKDSGGRMSGPSTPPVRKDSYKYSTRQIDAITDPAARIEVIVEHIRFGQRSQWFDYSRGYIMQNPWGGGRWVVFLFGYEFDPAEAKQFESLSAARQWGKQTIRKRRVA